MIQPTDMKDKFKFPDSMQLIFNGPLFTFQYSSFCLNGTKKCCKFGLIWVVIVKNWVTSNSYSMPTISKSKKTNSISLVGSLSVSTCCSVRLNYQTKTKHLCFPGSNLSVFLPSVHVPTFQFYELLKRSNIVNSISP